MDNGNTNNNNSDKEMQQIILQSNNYNVTVIPVEFPGRNRLFGCPSTSSSNSNDEFGFCQDNNNQWTNNGNNKEITGGALKKKELFTQQENLLIHPITQPHLRNSTINLPSSSSSSSTFQHPHHHNHHHYLQQQQQQQQQVEPDEEEQIYEEISTRNILCEDLNETLLNDSSIIPICVYLHNKTVIAMEIEDTENVTCELICQAIVGCEEIGLISNIRNLALQVFTLWMISPILEIQLKPQSKPYKVRQNWQKLIEKYGHASQERKENDEPKLIYQRNVFFSQHIEEKIQDQKILELLYEEAKYNVLNGRYPSEMPHLIQLGGLQAREELGSYNDQLHTTTFFREKQSNFLPAHIRKSPTWSWFPISGRNSAETQLLEQFKKYPKNTSQKTLIRRYLDNCWSFPFYGAAFFEGQIEQPIRGLISLLTHQDIPVLVAINSRGIYVIDDINCEIILALQYHEFSWNFSRPSREDNPDSLCCIYLQFNVVENGMRVSKILQIFSKQATLIDTLINSFVLQKKQEENGEAGKSSDSSSSADSNDNGNNSFAANYGQQLCTKLNRLTLATFDEDGRCIGQMGSWAFSY